MSTIDTLIAEFNQETQTTRRHLERLPDDQLDWRPHAKSFTARDLGSHIVECVRWTESIFRDAVFDFNPATFKSYRASSVADLLDAFDGRVAEGARAMAAVGDHDLDTLWHLKVMGRVRVEKSKAAAFKDFTLHHLIHHRGQLSVYLRLLDVAVPGSYGPTADER
jgi:uncharacterized damage-inducible protein DinB